MVVDLMKTFGCFSIWAKFAGLEPTQVLTWQGRFLHLENETSRSSFHGCWGKGFDEPEIKIEFPQNREFIAQLNGKFCFHSKTLQTLPQHSSIFDEISLIFYIFHEIYHRISRWRNYFVNSEKKSEFPIRCTRVLEEWIYRFWVFLILFIAI